LSLASLRNHPVVGQEEGGWFFKFITKPGVWLQNLTTKSQTINSSSCD
jgi:uncharacterized protein YqhQ